MEYRPFVVSEAKNRWARRCKIELAGGYGHARGLSAIVLTLSGMVSGEARQIKVFEQLGEDMSASVGLGCRQGERDADPQLRA
jgi:hypothetical protein